MKLCGAILACSVVGVALQVDALGVTASSEAHPYQPIIVRNVFRLRALQVHVEPSTPRPPIITLQGITCLDRKQVLFKILMTLKPGEPPKEVSLVLSEGDHQGEIEVLEIDTHAATVKFRNHSQVQTLRLGVPPDYGVPK